VFFWKAKYVVEFQPSNLFLHIARVGAGGSISGVNGLAGLTGARNVKSQAPF
jgi:hypothetical protein